ncbi:PepSY domain-containing protein [Psychrobacter sp. 16-MNA-CIBAN-0192]|uniref:PepSY domain-containing protein n=1 Tax=Psychrobacter sp. 16-MNA-CIBAN-0192 TaxID=3140448 RepID=UPI00332898A0
MKKLSILTKSMIVTLTVAGIGATAIAAPIGNTKAATSSGEAVSAMQSKISLTQAITIAKQNAKGDLVSAEFDYDDDNATSKYEVEFIGNGTSYEVKIDANTGKVLKTEQEKLDKKDMAEYSAMKQAKVTLTSAMQTAAQSVNGKVISVEFELDKGQSVYDIEVVKGNQIYDVTIDGNTGKVLSSQVDVEDDD